jgi:hypothetical protein
MTGIVVGLAWSVAAVESAAGLPVPVLTQIRDEDFPPAWRTRAVRAHAEPLDPNEAERSRAIAARAMAKYPADLLRRHLRGVYFASRLQFYGLSFGGTYSDTALYLANRGPAEGFTDAYLEESFHHEFSSILLANRPDALDQAAWRAGNGWPYGSSGAEALRSGRASTRYTAAWHERGFLAEYASASLEEDFNMMAEGLFAGGSRFWSAIDAHPRLHAKMRLAAAFYSRLAPGLDEEYFRRLASH